MAAVVSGYVIGSLPLGYFAGRRWAGVDLRHVGSRNVGATNMYRVSGARLGLLVMLLDVAKGAVAVALAAAWSTGWPKGRRRRWPRWPATSTRCGCAAGVARAWPWCGAFAMLAPLPTLIAAALFVLTVAVTRMASAGSVIAAASLPPLAAITGAGGAVAAGAAGAALLILWRHRGNLARLWRGTERRLAHREVPRA